MKRFSALLSLLALVTFLVWPMSSVNAAITQAYIRFDRMSASATSNVTVVITPVTVLEEGKIIVTFPAEYTVSATPTINVLALPAGVDAVPGTLSISGSGQVVTVTGVTDMTVGTDYGFNIATGITNPATPGSYEIAIATTEVDDGPIDSSTIATKVLTATTGDQIVLTATVPPTFNFTLSANSASFASDLSSSAVVSTGGTTVTVVTNADKGWIAWVRSANTSLDSAITSQVIETTGTVNGTPDTLSVGVDGYVLDVDATTDHGTGTGTLTIAPEYNGTDTSSGGTLSATHQPIASCDGTTAGDVITLIARASITSVKSAADDYTDTLTVVGAGNF